jgi:hypothetical protein
MFSPIRYRPAMRDGAFTLLDVRAPTLTIVCEPCGRRGRYNVERLMAKNGNAKILYLLAAHAAGIEFYGLLSDMREQTRLSVVAGIFHEWEKKLRDWLAREIQRWHRGDDAIARVWSANFGEIAALLESFGWRVSGAACFRTLDGCRLVVNVYMHGEGDSLNVLKQTYPEYLDDPFRRSGRAFFGTKYGDHRYLKVSDGQFQAFSDAIVAFWRDVPENVFASEITDVPNWFAKAIQ